MFSCVVLIALMIAVFKLYFLSVFRKVKYKFLEDIGPFSALANAKLFKLVFTCPPCCLVSTKKALSLS